MTIRIGIASTAHPHSASYAAALSRRPDVELRVAELDELLAWAPHGVVICAENHRHRELTERAAAAGVHVLCEKPLATNVADAVAMIDACERAGVHLATAYPVRFHPALAALRAGRPGRLYSAVGVNTGIAPGGWFADTASGGGAILDHTVHLADLLTALVDAPPVEVYAQANRIVAGAGGDAETGGLLVVTHADGFVASIDCSWSEPSGFPRWGGLSLTLHGSGGSVHFDPFADELTGYDATRTASAPYLDLDALLLADFVDAIRERRPPDRTALRSLAVAEAASTSAATGRPEPVHPLGGR
ncbi:Gfo/Idh/MocA family protein [Cryptosporangium arvum]|uniref:Putative dehydrogenase n=1 Tax=Cryptosporangium arvum DSM 44712 TaxID=927661 RepID=A0A010ZPQ0_9ACTN|nr:Gfo/Idh/MocA family oxidoreductase [Cryptosporangium arvum]EXG80654.1 putative dehydrogenase [Cryptosporangium arvum DSM 44712]